MHRAAANNSVLSLQALIDAGADLNRQDNGGRTPMHRAATYNSVLFLQALIDAGADLHRQDNEGQTPMHTAALENSVLSLQALIDAGADLNRQDNDGWTPMHTAAGNNNVLSLQALIDAGADLNRQDNGGETALIRATKFNITEAAAVLLKSGAQVELRNKEGKDAPEMVTKEGSLRVAKLLTEYTAAGNFRRPAQTTVRGVEGIITKTVSKVDATNPSILQCIRDKEHVYEMKSRKRGRCLIINNNIFHNEYPRIGTEKDSENLERLFLQLQFDVRIVDDCTAEGIKHELGREKHHQDHQKADAFVLCILSHGGKDLVCGVDGKDVNIDSDIMAPLDGEHWPSMHGKPKLVIIQACQGIKRTTGKVVADEPGSAVIQQRICVDAMCDEGRKLHEKTDILLALSTVPDYVSFRDTSVGTWFIQHLVEVFYDCAHKYHVADMLTMVKRKVTEERTEDGYLQVPETRTRFTKNFFFFPGYPEH